MHTDRVESHIISIIFHIGSSPDSEPWPLFIEDFHGRTHEVVLAPGDLLFYESSKCFHGRPKPFRGSWYSSVFVHYYPDDDEWKKVSHSMEAHYAIPKHWSQDPGEEDEINHEFLETEGVSLREPECPNDWCRTTDRKRIRWSGPGQHGFLTIPNYPNFDKIPFRSSLDDGDGVAEEDAVADEEL